MLNMAKISKDTIPEHTKNIKINTRIMITSVLAIIIPIIIISTAASIFFYTSKDKYDFTSVTAKSYTVINQIQWSQTVNEISANLVNDKEPDRKLSDLKKSFQPLEKLGTMIYIEQNGSEYYSTGSKEKILEEAQSIAKTDITKNSYYYGENGVSVIAHAQNENESYLIVIANGDYDVPDITTSASPQSVIIKLANNTVAIFSLCIAIFIIAIIIISLITSKTIVGPIEKITRGADEIAKGNLDYEIDYKSTNELGRLAQSFNEMRIKVKDSIEQKNKSDQQQKEMIAGIAHDLRTPLTSIKGYLEGIRDGVANTPEKQARYFNTIYDSANSMENMLNDLLTISKLELGTITLHPENVRINDFLQYSKELGRDLQEADFDFEIINSCKSNPLLSIDTDRFARVIDNIISNSIKYKREGVKGKITLSISEYEHSVIFEIADNGMGVDNESLGRIFDTLYRADKARSNVSNGSGLGLAVCRQIVQQHGGLIWAQNNSQGGLSIFISLPKQEESAAPRA